MQMYYDETKIEAGLDEAGRGSLCSIVVAACVILPKKLEGDMVKYIKDSKQLSKKKREQMYDYIIENAIDYSIQYKNEEYIDKNNILVSVMDCMHEAINNLKVKPELLLVDGSYFTKYKGIEHINVISGDAKFHSIASSSILAKVAHDRYIKQLCLEEPYLDERYGLLSNMGYGTNKHMEGIKKYGISKYHRKTFGICKDYA
jgi:ribonuclease HII